VKAPQRVLRAVRMWHAENRRTWRSQFQNMINATKIEEYRLAYKSKFGESLPYASVVAKAVAIAMREFLPQHPELNSYLKRGIFGKSVVYFDRLSFGCTFSVPNPEGYEQIVIAVCEDPDRKDLNIISQDLKAKFQPSGKTVQSSAIYFRLPWILQKILAFYGENSQAARFHHRGTYSYTALGKFGVDSHDVPTSSTLTFGMGQIKDQVFAIEGKPAVARGFILMMTIDRRLMNGQVPAEFMGRVSQILETATFDSI
jgi:pyruvate/2-oxoglutarate dehydrogenase complex dihydrolipoamide acyltransferase (E2) component